MPTVPRLYLTLTLLTDCLAQIGQPAGEQNEGERSHFRQIFTSKDVQLLAAFILVYVGIEVTLGGTSESVVSLSYAGFTTMFRLDCDVYHRRPWRWPIVWVYLFRILRRYVASRKGQAPTHLNFNEQV